MGYMLDATKEYKKRLDATVEDVETLKTELEEQTEINNAQDDTLIEIYEKLELGGSEL